MRDKRLSRKRRAEREGRDSREARPSTRKVSGVRTREPLAVAYVGNFRPAHSTENQLAESLRALGHEVRELQEDEADVWPRAGDAATEADLLLWTCTWRNPETFPTIRRVIEELDRTGVPTVSVHLDRFGGLRREHLVTQGADPFFRTRHVFTADGGRDPWFHAHGVNHSWLAPGAHEPWCTIGTERRAWLGDVGFVGAYRHYHPEWGYRRQLVDHLRRRYRAHYRHFGGGIGPEVRRQDLSDAVASVKVWVGDSCLAGNAGRYWSERVYELIGRGAFLIHPWVEGLDDHLEDGVHLVTYDVGNLGQLDDLIARYLEDDEGRRRIAEAGRARVLERHTYRHRMAAMLETLAEREPQLRAWPGEVRDGTTDADVLREVFEEDVYRARDLIRPGDVVVDLGANVGMFSVWAAQRGARVRAVEPFSENLQQLGANLEAAGVFADVEVVPAAVGAAVGLAKVEPGPGANRSGGARVVEADPSEQEGLVQVLPLRKLLEGLDEVAFLKVDVEGYEHAAIAWTPTEDLERVRAMAIEFHPGEPSTLGRIVEHLSESHHVEVLGAASRGGYVYARRYGS